MAARKRCVLVYESVSAHARHESGRWTRQGRGCRAYGIGQDSCTGSTSLGCSVVPCSHHYLIILICRGFSSGLSKVRLDTALPCPMEEPPVYSARKDIKEHQGQSPRRAKHRTWHTQSHRRGYTPPREERRKRKKEGVEGKEQAKRHVTSRDF